MSKPYEELKNAMRDAKDAMLNVMQLERAIDPKLAQLVTEYNNGRHIPAHDLLVVLASFGFVRQEPWPRSFEIKHISFEGGYPALIDANGRIALMGYDQATADRIGPRTWAGNVQSTNAAQAIADADAAFADEVSQLEALVK